MNEPVPALALTDVRRTFAQGGNDLRVLKGATCALQAGEIVALVGPSGAGKSTLLHIAGLLEHADGGDVQIDGRSCGGLSDAERTTIRRDKLGFVYQFHHLLPEFSALENIVVPQMIAGRDRGDATARAGELLDHLGLRERASHRPARLSGGEQQRIAIARALANDPLLLLADEPTGNLDQATARTVFAELLGFVRGRGMAALIATHNDELARAMDRVLRMQDGALVPG
jgi:lipoprotein-releasing system ATP-binding protein